MASNRARYEPMTREAATRHGIDAEVFVRQIDAESGFDPLARSPSGALGLAQIIPRWHPSVDPLDPPAALDYAARWMRDLIRAYGSYQEALAAYNWGPGNVSRWDGRPDTLPAETRRYLDKILGPGWPEPDTEEKPLRRYAFPILGYRGAVTNHWGTSERGGSDLFAARGTPLIAMHDGTVTYAGYDPLGGHNCVMEGDDGLTYYYAHADRLSIRTGQRVRVDQQIGTVGDSGNAKNAGPHLHIGIGYGIRSGGGAGGGCGINYDAVGLLQRVLAGGPEEDDMARVAELEEQLAGWQTWWDMLRPEVRSWAHALDATRADREDDGWDQVKAVSTQLHEHFKEAGE
jgi:murein DD-endopeptidase MepM/ murein hydrolase activator NlpD